jgi:hypothetical protein
VGWLPRALARRYVKFRKKVAYDHVRLLSVFQLKALAGRTAFHRATIDLPAFSAAELASATPAQRRLVGLYHRVKEWPVFRQLLLLFAPVFQVLCVRDSTREDEGRPAR